MDNLENKEVNSNLSENNFEKIQKSFFEKVDEKSGTFFFIIAILCFVIFVISLVYFATKVRYDKEENFYTAKKGRNIYTFKIEEVNHFTNDFYSNTDDITIEKENEYSSLVYTDFSSIEENENLKINADLPEINISSKLSITEINQAKEKIRDINERIQTIRTVFEGNNKLNFDYYAYYYQDTLSFGYSYYENFNNVVSSEDFSFVYNSDKKKTLTLAEYLKTRNANEAKISEVLKEIIRREKLKYKYNKKTNNFYVDSKGDINLIIDKNRTLKINIEQR